MKVFNKNRIFKNKNGESLALWKIVSDNDKKIISVTIAYLSKEREERAKGIKGLLGFKELIQDPKEVSVEDPQGIRIVFVPETCSAMIRFSKKEEFNKISEDDCDPSTLSKSYIMAISQPYSINFHIGNLKKVDWC